MRLTRVVLPAPKKPVTMMTDAFFARTISSIVEPIARKDLPYKCAVPNLSMLEHLTASL
jgi:hypothetical protein